MVFNEARTASRREVLNGLLRPIARIGPALHKQHKPADLVRAFLERLGVSARIPLVGMTEERIKAVADLALNDWFITGNPRQVSDAEPIVEMLQAALMNI
jgi:alcohol dehydrogenase class IV